jgi:hypothetical protein
MRSYIFTPLERKVLTRWLNGEATLKDIRVQKVLSRVRLFKELAGDVELYARVKAALAKSEAT